MLAIVLVVTGYIAFVLYVRRENKKFSKMYDELKREIEGEDDGCV